MNRFFKRSGAAQKSSDGTNAGPTNTVQSNGNESGIYTVIDNGSNKGSSNSSGSSSGNGNAKNDGLRPEAIRD